MHNLMIGATKYCRDGGMIVAATYPNGLPALRVVDAESGSPLLTATVNMDPDIPDKYCVFIKNWSENEGVLQALIDAGHAELTGRKVDAGYVVAVEVRLLGNLRKLLRPYWEGMEG